MEIYNVVGFRKVNFKDAKTGNQVDGYTLFLERVPGPDENITGVECVKQFIASQYVQYVPALDDRIRLVYNKYGKIGAVETC